MGNKLSLVQWELPDAPLLCGKSHEYVSVSAILYSILKVKSLMIPF